MLTAGVSVPRVHRCLCSWSALLTTGAEHLLSITPLAPHAEYARKKLLEDPKSRGRQRGLLGQIFRNRTDNRTWFIQQFEPGENDFSDRAHRAAGRERQHRDAITLATSALYHPETKRLGAGSR